LKSFLCMFVAGVSGGSLYIYDNSLVRIAPWLQRQVNILPV